MPINYKLYPPHWKTEIIPEVWKRSRGECEECGLYHGQLVWSVQVKHRKGKKTIYRKIWVPLDPCLPEGKAKKVMVVLTVAHLDNDAHNHAVKLDRLKHLCQRCHLRMDAKYKAIKRICGHYCRWPNCDHPAAMTNKNCQDRISGPPPIGLS